MTTTSARKVLCPDCNKVFVHPRNLLQHRRVQHQGIRYYCQDCNHSYTRQYNLQNHRMKAHPEKMPPEEVRLFKQKFLFPIVRNGLIQPNNHHRPLPPAAPGNAVPRRRKPAIVRRVVPNGVILPNGSLPLPAHKVTVPEADAKASATVHVLSDDSISTANRGPAPSKLVSNRSFLLDSHGHSCPLCPFSTKSLGLLKMHLGRHSNEVRRGALKCDFCNFSSDKPATLVQHKIIHFNAVPTYEISEEGEVGKPLLDELQCPNCDLSFPTFSDLQAHQNRHQ